MSQTTFWNLLKENKIEIPIIQRDYAQGREGKEYLRQTFLESLKEALDENKVLKLDFVYGSAENGALQPLDGQQRLTTLWLLHWYMAMRAGKLHEAGDALKKFTYETRISSREFCEELCNASNFDSYVKYCNGCKPLEKCPRKSIVDFITSQTWFYSSWKQDPTIQSMLRMLGGTQIKGKSGNDIPDGIEEVFGEESNFNSYWEKLESDNAPIVFYYLPLKDFGLSDDLYIKMNARGKQLTNFENFKADLVGYIKKKANEDETWKKFLQSENNVGIPIKLDTDWTDIFWQNKTDDGRIDEIYFAFLNRYFLHYAIVDLDANEKSIIWKLYGDESNDSALSYDNGFQIYEDILNENLLEKLSSLFDSLKQIVNKIIKDEFGNNVKSINDKIRSYLPEWVPSFDFIPQYTKRDNGEYEVVKDSFGNNLYKVTTLTQPQRVVFFGICRYLEECKSFDEGQFKRWMRVVCNLTENNAVDTIDAMRSRIKLINELSSHYTDIYGFLSDKTSEIKSDAAKEQLKEEIEKAKQILKGNYNGNIDELKGRTWEDVIIEAENYAFFKGAIRFLFRDENGEWDWKDFDTKWKNVQKYFDGKGVKDNKYELLKKYISFFNNWELHFENDFIFDSELTSWRKNFLSINRTSPTHKLLIGEDKLPKSSLLDPYQRYVQDFFLDTNALVTLGENIPGSTIKKRWWCGDTYVIYPYNCKAEWKIYYIHYRNKLLTDLNEISFKDKNQETWRKNGLCWSKNIFFEFKGWNFLWDEKNVIHILREDLTSYDGDNNIITPQDPWTKIDLCTFTSQLQSLIDNCSERDKTLG